MPTPSEGSVTAERVWKRFRSDRRRMLLRDEVERVRDRWRGDGTAGWRWALTDVDLSVAPGEAVALLGSNGSGKSTLLKVLSSVMFPYAGRVQVAGRIGALIEVRSGIHPDLTGRENIALSGALQGLSRSQVAARFDEIVAFAELEDAIDRPLKFYSSGMEMRLGFAVAAFLEPDVLLVDEVLAVGDALFQQKCLERIRTVLGRGTTLVFVSHDLAAVEATCTRGVWLRGGAVSADGPVRETLGAYRSDVERQTEASHVVDRDSDVRLEAVGLAGPLGATGRTNQPFEVTLTLGADGRRTGVVHLGVSEGPATPIFVLGSRIELGPGSAVARCCIPHLPLPRGCYFAWVGVTDRNGRDLLAWQPAARFDVAGPDLDPAPRAVVRLAPVNVPHAWTVDGDQPPS